jgi:hypothetical protein
MANPNIISATSIYGKTDAAFVATTAVAVSSNAASSGKVLRVNSLVVSNTSPNSPIDVSVILRRGSTEYFIVRALSIPEASSVVVIGRENPMYLNENDSLRAVSDVANLAHAVCSYEEIG